jgi:hypothetical protein
MSRFGALICVVILVFTAGSVSGLDGVSIDLTVAEVVAAQERAQWSDSLGSRVKGRIGHPSDDRERPTPHLVQRGGDLGAGDASEPRHRYHHQHVTQALQQRAVKATMTAKHFVDVPLTEEQASELDPAEYERARLTKLPPLRDASPELLALALDVDTEGLPQTVSVFGRGGAALLNASVALCNGDAKWSSDCPSPGVFVAGCAGFRPDELGVEERLASAAENDAGFRLGVFGRGVADLTTAWPLEYVWTSPEMRETSPRCDLRDVMCGGTPLYRRMPTVATRRTPPSDFEALQRPATLEDATHCFLSQALSPFYLCSNSLMRVLDAALSGAAAAQDIDVEQELASLAAASGPTTERTEHHATLRDRAFPVLLGPWRAVTRAHQEGAEARYHDMSARYAEKDLSRSDVPGLFSGGTVADRMSHFHKRAWSHTAVAERVALLEACEALVARPEQVGVFITANRARLSGASRPTVRVEVTVRVEATLTAEEEARAFLDDMLNQIAALRAVTIAPSDRDVKLSFGVAGSTRCDVTGACASAEAMESAAMRLLSAAFPMSRNAPLAIKGSAEAKVASVTAPKASPEVVKAPQTVLERQPFAVNALVEARGEHRGRLRVRLSMELSPVAEDSFADEFTVMETLPPVAGAVDVLVRWPMLLYKPHLATARLVAVRGSPTITFVGTGGDSSFAGDRNFSSLAHPCFADPIVASSRVANEGGIVETHLHVPIVSTAWCHQFLRSAASSQEADPSPTSVDVDVLVDFGFAHLHADEYAPDMNRYYTMPVIFARRRALVAQPAARGIRRLHGINQHVTSGTTRLPLDAHRFVGPYFDANLEFVAANRARELSRISRLAAASTQAFWTSVGERVAFARKSTFVDDWSSTSLAGLAASPPIPDRAMPFNALAFCCTIIAFVTMSVWNVAVRGTAAARTEMSEDEAKQLVEEISRDMATGF